MPAEDVNFWRIHTYKVLLTQSGAIEKGAVRNLHLTNRSGLIRASIQFRRGNDLGSITLDPPGPLRQEVLAVWPTSRFAEVYEAIRSEDPLFVGYVWEPIPGTPGFGGLLQFGITSDERPWWES